MTSLFERELVAHLVEKHHALIDKYPPKRRILGVKRTQFEQPTNKIAPDRKRSEVFQTQVR
jgi:hypothetical protein